MSQASLEALHTLSETIQDEEMSILIDRMAKSFLHDGHDDSEPEDPRKQTEYEKNASVLLRTLRVHLCLDLLKQGYTTCLADFKKDWEEIIGSLKFLEYEWETTPEILSDAVDIILLMDPNKRNTLLKKIDFSTRLKIKVQKPLRSQTFFRAIHMTEYCLETNRIDEACSIISNLIKLSEDRNASDLNRHREVIRRSLWYIVDANPHLTVEICEQQRKYFQFVTDFNASRFYWFYASALNVVKRTEESMPLYKRCYDLCQKVEGETSWIGARAGQAYFISLLDSEDSVDAEAYLWGVLQKIDNNFYVGMDASVGPVGAFTRYVLLKAHMEKQTLRGYLPEIERLREYCYQTEATAPNPFLTVRSIENMLSAYYLNTGDYLQAAQHSVKALESIPPNNLERVPSDDLLYTNLLQIYSQLNDADSMIELVHILTDKMDQYEENDFYYFRMCLLIQSAEKRLGISMDDRIPDYRKALLDFHQELTDDIEDIPDEEDNGGNLAFALWTLDLLATVLDSSTATPNELKCYQDIVIFFRNHPHLFGFNDVQKMILHMLLAQAEWQSGSAHALSSLQTCLRYAKLLPESHETYISVLRFAAVVYNSMGRSDLALAVIEEAFSGITTAWHKATAYLNDHKVCQLLSIVQLQFGTCLSILRTLVTPQKLYEQILRFKNLPALVGRERNRLLQMSPVDDQLKSQIFRTQDQLATAQFNDSLLGTNTSKDIFTRLQYLEAEFANSFPQNLNFTDITYAGICHNLPDNAAIIEYYFVAGTQALSGRSLDTEIWEMDIFITTKISGNTQLHYLKVSDGDQILEQATDFVSILQMPDNATRSGDKNVLRGELYRKLIAPALPYLDGIRTLFIAPDRELCNLPFEILYAGDSGILQETFKVCRLVSGRDLLFTDDSSSPARNCFVLGDPDYEAEKGERIDSLERGASLDLLPVRPLPFSRIEAVRVGQRCHTTPCLGKSATKYALQEALPCGIIHIATHGLFDVQMKTDSLYSSHLVFAGYNKWLSQKVESPYCGNGILTADEISRLDLRKTELVVLSACQTGMGDTSYGSVQGLLSAFSAAGVRWVITHMWHANDYTTPILMDAFYDAYLNKYMDVPDALQYAKNYLKTVTVGELRKNGWLDKSVENRLNDKAKAMLYRIRGANDRRRFFDDEFYWGGFVCHKCK